MIIVIDNFFAPWQLKLVTDEVKKLQFYNIANHPKKDTGTDYPGIRTEDFHRDHSLLDSFIIQSVGHRNTIFSAHRPWGCQMYAHLRTKDAEKSDFIHKDLRCDWAFLIYLSETNLESGTKFYKSVESSKEDDNMFVKFEQNRIIMFDSSVPHMSYNNHGKDLNDGRLTINGFCKYT